MTEREETTSWRELIREARSDANDDLGELEACTLSEEGLDVRFENDWGNEGGEPFTAWTRLRVYFPIRYDGLVWVGSAPRYPCSEATAHQVGPR